MKIREPVQTCGELSRMILKGVQLTLPTFVFIACTPELQPSIEMVQPTTAAPTQESLSPTPTSTPEPTPTETPTAQPSPTPVCSGNRLVFSMGEGGIEKASIDGLYIACSDGSYILQLTNTSPSMPSVSPDGRRIALAVSYSTVDEQRAAIEIIDVNTGNDMLTLENTLGNTNWSPSWSPNNEYVLYRKTMLEYDSDHEDMIEVVHVDSAITSQVLVSGEIYHSAWSPDGECVAYSKIGLTIYTMGIECDDSTHQCKRTDEPRLIFSGGDQPSWSPDGTQIVAVCPKLGSLHETLCLMDVEGNLIQEFDHGLWFIQGPVWSPDGNMIAFSAKQEEGAGNDIYILSLDDSSLINLTIDTELVVGSPAWVPNESTSR